MIVFNIPGEPTAKGRARSFIRNGRVAHKTPEKTERYEARVAVFAQRAMSGSPPTGEAVVLSVTAWFAVPKSWTKTKTLGALQGSVHHTSRPDLDNIVKAIKDGLNGVVFKDDSQVVTIVANKCYGSVSSVDVTVEKATQ